MGEGLTLVIYDLKTIPDLLNELAVDHEDHAGILFVNDATIRCHDYGGLIRALLSHWEAHQNEDWMNRIAFLAPVR